MQITHEQFGLTAKDMQMLEAQTAKVEALRQQLGLKPMFKPVVEVKCNYCGEMGATVDVVGAKFHAECVEAVAEEARRACQPAA